MVVVPTPTDPAGIRTCARDLRTWSAAKKHTDEDRGGRHDPHRCALSEGMAGRGELPVALFLLLYCYEFSFCRNHP